MSEILWPPGVLLMFVMENAQAKKLATTTMSTKDELNKSEALARRVRPTPKPFAAREGAILPESRH
ncbi:hypothetical protein [Caballeronia ptereochthonis]|uniref:hypothetical protein n=1 Tax=Caballeronia ptereochthonis TaxID=1777144 RepID=UPI000B3583D9|nr:hypothetical protein [Caballeronia ptereochthonis]